MSARISNRLDREAHTGGTAAGGASIRLQTAAGREERKAELNALADWYALRGDAETAADYRAQAENV